jgi:hypothetical protein
MKIPFAKKLSGTTAAMHLAVYAAIIWILFQARRQMKQTDGFQDSDSPPIYSHTHTFEIYSLCTWYTNTIITKYFGGMYLGEKEAPNNYTHMLYPIDLNTGKLRSTPLDIATEVKLYSVDRPQFDSSSPAIPTVGFYLTTAQYSVTFSESTSLGVYDEELDMKYAIAGTKYSNMWFDTVIDKNGNPLPVVLSNPLNLDTTNKVVIPMTTPSTTPTIVPFGPILFPPTIPTSAGDITPPLSTIPTPSESTDGVSDAAVAEDTSGGLSWYWILLISVVCIVAVLIVYVVMKR